MISSATSPNAKGRIVGGQVTLAIPTASMASLLNSLPSDFTASSINFSSVDDTTPSSISTRASPPRRRTSPRSRALLAKATSLDDITTLEQQIEDVETSIDTDQGQLNTLDPGGHLRDGHRATHRARGGHGGKAATGPSVSSGVSKGWNNLLAIAAVAVEVLVTAIPALMLLLIGGGVAAPAAASRRRRPR